MAQKPRVKAPKQRQSSSSDAASRRRAWTIGAAVAGVALGFAVVAVLLGVMGGSDGPDEASLRADLEAAGCTLKVAPTRGNTPETSHSVTDPNGTSPRWNTDPPTSGPHYGIAAIFGIYEDELQLARVVHNLEHGGIYILYGKDVPDATVDQLRAFYDDHKAGTIMAPLDRLGDEFALGAWLSDGDTDNGYLAKCKTFDQDAVSSFFSALQFRGPERFDPADLQPGH